MSPPDFADDPKTQQRLRERNWRTDPADVIAAIRAAEASCRAATEEARQLYKEAITKIKAALAPELAPIELDPDYHVADFETATTDSIRWVIDELRRCLVPHGPGYTVDFDRASTKPPTPKAMLMMEHCARDRKFFDRLLSLSMKNARKVRPAAKTETRQKSPDELEAEMYLKQSRQKKAAKPEAT